MNFFSWIFFDFFLDIFLDFISFFLAFWRLEFLALLAFGHQRRGGSGAKGDEKGKRLKSLGFDEWVFFGGGGEGGGGVGVVALR